MILNMSEILKELYIELGLARVRGTITHSYNLVAGEITLQQIRWR